jgi:hypothetical protein
MSSNYHKKKATEATKPKEEKRKNPSPRKWKACPTVNTALM